MFVFLLAMELRLDKRIRKKLVMYMCTDVPGTAVSPPSK